jgi:hypothetical protein
MRVAGRPLALLVGILKALYLRDVRQVLWQILEATSRRTGDAGAEGAVPLVAAESISPVAKDPLKAEWVGYFDAGAACTSAHRVRSFSWTSHHRSRPPGRSGHSFPGVALTCCTGC